MSSRRGPRLPPWPARVPPPYIGERGGEWTGPFPAFQLWGPRGPGEHLSNANVEAYLAWREAARGGDLLAAPECYPQQYALDIGRGWETTDVIEAVIRLFGIARDAGHPALRPLVVKISAALAWRRYGIDGVDQVVAAAMKEGHHSPLVDHVLAAHPHDADLVTALILARSRKRPKGGPGTTREELELAYAEALRICARNWDAWTGRPFAARLVRRRPQARWLALTWDHHGGSDRMIRLRPAARHDPAYIENLLGKIRDLVGVILRTRSGEWPGPLQRPRLQREVMAGIVDGLGGFGPQGDPYTLARPAVRVDPPTHQGGRRHPAVVPEVRAGEPVRLDIAAIMSLHEEADRTAARLAVGDPAADPSGRPSPTPAAAGWSEAQRALLEALDAGPVSREEMRRRVGPGVLLDGLLELLNEAAHARWGDAAVIEEGDGLLRRNPDVVWSGHDR